MRSTPLLIVQQRERGRSRQIINDNGRNIHSAKRKLGAAEFGRFSTNSATTNLGFQQKLLPATNQRTYNNILPTFIASVPDSLRNLHTPRPILAIQAQTSEFATPMHHVKKVKLYTILMILLRNSMLSINLMSSKLNSIKREY